MKPVVGVVTILVSALTSSVLRLSFIVTLAFMSGMAWADTTGNDLYNNLTSTDSSLNLRGYAYLEGVIDSEDWYLTADIFSSFNPKSTGPEKFKIAHICFGNSPVTLGQLKDVVVKYLTEHPEKRHLRAQVLIRFALLEHFACANNPSDVATK